MHEEVLARCAVDVVERLDCSSGFWSFVTSADFGPRFFKDLYPHFSGCVLNSDRVFVSGKAELLDTLLVSIEWEPVVHNDFKWFSVHCHPHAINTSSIYISCQEVVSDSESLLLMGDFRRIFSKTCDCRQKVAVRQLALDNISWIDAIKDDSFTTFVSEVVSCTSPVELGAGDVLPLTVRLMLSSVDEESLWSMRKRWIIPQIALLDNALPILLSESSPQIRIGRDAIYRLYKRISALFINQWLVLILTISLWISLNLHFSFFDTNDCWCICWSLIMLFL